MTESIFDYWRFGDLEPRATQIEALKWIETLPADKKYIMCELPVGAGKSNMAINYSSWLAQSFGNSFVLTPQKILQKQYEDSFEAHYIGSMYGKSNYECKTKNTNCDIGNDIKPKCDMCVYTCAKDRAMASPNMVLNYKLAFLLFKYADRRKFPPRKLMIFDECHTLENHLTEFNAVSISEFRCKKLGILYFFPKKLKDTLQWLETDYSTTLNSKVSEYSRVIDEINDELEFNPRRLSSAEQQKYRDFKNLKEHKDGLDFILDLAIEEIQDRFVLVEENKSFKFKELYGKNVFNSLVKPMADKFLFMSSTILNKDSYCKDLGIDPEEAAFISLPSEFPAENRPVVLMPTMKMNYEWNKDFNYGNRQNMIVKVKEICDMHAEQSGIIHSGNFLIAEWLVAELSGLIPHLILHHNPSGNMPRDEVLTKYMELAPKQPVILISPSITEGLDLKEDLARLCIFVKTPYPNLGDAWVKRRFELSNEWYSRQALINIIQGGGRIVRSATDWGNTFILDASFENLYNRMHKSIPDWWKEGYNVI